MPIGNKIKEFRVKNSLTQKDLAEKLNVTFQAVSRWENNEAEPSFDTLKEMTVIFGCTADDLFEIEKDASAPEAQEEQAQPEEPKETVFVICDSCKKHITEESDLNRVEEEVTEYRGRMLTKKVVQHTLCNDCLKAREEKEKEAQKKAAEELAESYRTRRIHSFVWPTILAALFIVGAVMQFIEGNLQNGFILIGVAVGAYTFLACMILFNTYLPNLWLSVASWGFVKMPGVIMEFSLNGIIAGIVIKIILWFLGFMLALAFIALATVIAIPLSVITYPFALRRNILQFGNI